MFLQNAIRIEATNARMSCLNAKTRRRNKWSNWRVLAGSTPYLLRSSYQLCTSFILGFCQVANRNLTQTQEKPYRNYGLRPGMDGPTADCLILLSDIKKTSIGLLKASSCSSMAGSGFACSKRHPIGDSQDQDPPAQSVILFASPKSHPELVSGSASDVMSNTGQTEN